MDSVVDVVICSVIELLCYSARQDSFHASKLQGQSMFKVRSCFTAYLLSGCVLNNTSSLQ